MESRAYRFNKTLKMCQASVVCFDPNLSKCLIKKLRQLGKFED